MWRMLEISFQRASLGHSRQSIDLIKTALSLHGFTEYPDFSFWDLNFYKGQECSRFADAVFQGRIDLFGEPSMEAIINFKWRLFAKRNAGSKL